jgi:prolipoprotein diacylglyceryl transferase
VSTAVATTVLAYLPSPDRGVWYIGPLPIRAYALCIIAGIVVAVLWGERRWTARGGARGQVIDIAVFAVPFGLVGGRLYHVATDWQTYFGPNGNPVDALKIWQGGLGIWGAIALGGVGAWIGCRRRGIPLPAFADAVAPGIVVAQGIGRLGNWFNQELYGAPTTVPWGLEIYRRVDPVTGAPDPLGGVALDLTPVEIVHPTFLYELLWDLIVAGIVVWADRRFRLGHGRAFALYVAGYTAGRFVIEQMRTDPATRVLGDLRINVVVAAIVFVAAAFYVVLAKKGREVLSEGRPVPARTPVAAAVAAGAVTVGAAVAESASSGGRGGAGEPGGSGEPSGEAAGERADEPAEEPANDAEQGDAERDADGDASGDGPGATDPEATGHEAAAAAPEPAESTGPGESDSAPGAGAVEAGDGSS